MRFLPLLLLVLLSVPAQAQDRPANWMAISFGALAGADIGITQRCIGAGTCREANPILRPLQDKPAWFGGAKAALNTATVVGIYRWTKPRSKTRYAAFGVLIAVQAVVVGSNIRQLRRNQ